VRGELWRVKGLIFTAILLIMLAILRTILAPLTHGHSESGAIAPAAPFPFWIESGLVRVGRNDAPGSLTALNLFAGRGETVDAQIIVRALAGGLSRLNLKVSGLNGPGRAIIPPSSITLYREYYVTVAGTAGYGGGSNPPQGAGTYPEPLIPFNDPETDAPLCETAAMLKACDTSIIAGQDQAYWVDISVPRGALATPPGVYTGSIAITSDQGTGSIPVTLTVWNFELSQRPTELSLMTLWPPSPGNTVRSLDQALMRNKVMGWFGLATNATAHMNNFGMNRFGLNDSYPIAIQCSGAHKSLPSTDQVNALAASFPPGLELDLYVADELNTCPKANAVLKTLGRNVHASNFGVKTLMTTDAPDPNLFDEGDGRSAIDHWVLLDSQEQWPKLPFNGEGDLWSYTSCNTGAGNTPEWMLDYPPINERIQAGFLNWMEGATGILYYRADGWTSGNTINSWNNLDTTACGGGFGRPGDGILMYPPGPIISSEPAPGIRLKAIRDGIQDFEYAHLLDSLGQGATMKLVLAPIAASWTNWNHDPKALEAVRQQLGQHLNQLSPP
jgi:hypothetical protein